MSRLLLQAVALLAAVPVCAGTAIWLLANQWPPTQTMVAASAGLALVGWWCHRQYRDTLAALAELRAHQLAHTTEPAAAHRDETAALPPRPQVPQLPPPPDRPQPAPTPQLPAPPRKELP